jgi:DNA-binding transcriptional regulator YhcF (GntR family)
MDDDECSVTEIAGMAEACPGTIAREFRRLVDAGVLTSRVADGALLVRANHQAPFYQPLHDLVVIALRPSELTGMTPRAVG